MNDDELRQAMSALENYNEQLESITRQVRLLQASRDETVRTQRTFQALAAAKPGEQVLIPVGASSFVNVIVAGHTDAIVSVGSQISVQKDLDGAVAFMGDTQKEIQAALTKAVAAMQELQSYTEALNDAVQTEYQARRQGAPTQ